MIRNTINLNGNIIDSIKFNGGASLDKTDGSITVAKCYKLIDDPVYSNAPVSINLKEINDKTNNFFLNINLPYNYDNNVIMCKIINEQNQYQFHFGFSILKGFCQCSCYLTNNGKYIFNEDFTYNANDDNIECIGIELERNINGTNIANYINKKHIEDRDVLIDDNFNDILNIISLCNKIKFMNGSEQQLNKTVQSYIYAK